MSKTLIATLAAATSVVFGTIFDAALGTSQASAQTAYEYYTAHAQGRIAPRQLNAADSEYYSAIFAAIDRQDWSGADALLAQRSDGLLHPIARAELYRAANSPRVELHQLQAWFERGRNLPQAEQLGRLALTRGAVSMPDLPSPRQLQPSSGASRRGRPATINDGTMPTNIREAILARISDDDSDGARRLLDGVDASLSPSARAEWRQRVAWSYYIQNRDAEALAMARTVSAGTGPWVAEGEWAAGLAAWRLGDCKESGESFERAAYHAANPELRSAALYWGSRAALRCRQPERSTELLHQAAGADETLYGMLAADQLGKPLPDRVSASEFTARDWNRLGGIENIRIAIALAEIGRDVLASQVLLHQGRIGEPADYGPLSRLARDLNLPSTQLYMAYNAPQGGGSDPASSYPAPKWIPLNGWQIDPALAYAHALQESNFRSTAVSPAQAQGLMQITPITVRHHAPRLGLDPQQIDIFDPSVNLAFGQRNLEMLRDDPATHGLLPKIMAAYNAGLSPLNRWNTTINDQGDPLLWMESIPYWETRAYVSIVMRNYWMYERQARADSSSRLALAQNAWPMFPGTSGSDGRVYLSASQK